MEAKTKYNIKALVTNVAQTNFCCKLKPETVYLIRISMRT